MNEIAICIPVYEKVELLRRNIDSILKQTYQQYKIIVTDDSKTDNVKIYINGLDDNHIIYKKNHIRLGASENTNESIRIAREHGIDIIKVLHQDDYFTDEKALEKYASAMEDPEVIAVFSGNYEQYREATNIHQCSCSDIEHIKRDLTYLYRANVIGAPSVMMFRADDILFDGRYSWLFDVDFYLRILKGNKWTYIYEPLITIGHDGAQLTDAVRADGRIIVKETISLFFKLRWLWNKESIKYLIYIINMYIKKQL